MSGISNQCRVRDAIQKAWSLRFQGLNADAETLLFELETQRESFAPEVIWQLELLRVSLLRAQGRLEDSNAKLELIAREIFQNRARAPYQFYMQKAINLYLGDEFSAALEFYLLADSVAENVSERLVSLMNILSCLDNLNLPWHSVLEDFEKLSLDAEVTEFSLPVQRQLASFLERSALRDGRFRDLFALAMPGGKKIDQAQFLRLWASSLAYVKTPLPHREDFLERLVLAPYFHLKNYRLKTILADRRIQSPSGPDEISTLQQVDRLYLWTWNWLKDPSETNRLNLSECLNSFDFAGALKKMAFEDFQMMRNALSWIALFQESLAPSIHRYLTHFTVKDCSPFLLFEYEFQLFELLRARHVGFDDAVFRERRDKNPLHASPDIEMSEFVERWTRDLEEKKAAPRRAGTVLINEETQQITWRGKSVVSQPIAQTLLALSQRKTLSFSEVLWLGFQIAPYDHDVHAAKIHNCLTRIKELLPKSVTIKTKDKMIFWQGPSDVVHRHSPHPLERRLLPDNFAIGGSAQGTTRRAFEKPFHPRLVVKKTQGKSVLTREELQDVMKLSKASTVRWLLKWQSQGLVKRHGSGRSITYHIDITDHHRINDLV